MWRSGNVYHGAVFITVITAISSYVTPTSASLMFYMSAWLQKHLGMRHEFVLSDGPQIFNTSLICPISRGSWNCFCVPIIYLCLWQGGRKLPFPRHFYWRKSQSSTTNEVHSKWKCGAISANLQYHHAHQKTEQTPHLSFIYWVKDKVADRELLRDSWMSNNRIRETKVLLSDREISRG